LAAVTLRGPKGTLGVAGSKDAIDETVSNLPAGRISVEGQGFLADAAKPELEPVPAPRRRRQTSAW
jgi:hypothetical protein